MQDPLAKIPFKEIETLLRYSDNYLYLREIYNRYDANEIAESRFGIQVDTSQTDRYTHLMIRRTLLHVAIECNRLHAVEALVSKGAKLDINYERLETETIRSFDHGQGSSAFFGDRHDREQEYVLGNESLSPLELACKLRHYDIAKFLLGKNAPYDRNKLSSEAIQTLNIQVLAP